MFKKVFTGIITKAQLDELTQESESLRTKYLRDGIEGTASGDNIDGIFDYVEGTSGYATTGFPSKSYYTTQIGTDVMDIYRGGIY